MWTAAFFYPSAAAMLGTPVDAALSSTREKAPSSRRTPNKKRRDKSRLFTFSGRQVADAPHAGCVRSQLVQIEVVFQLHPHRDWMPVLHRRSESDLLRRGNGAFS